MRSRSLFFFFFLLSCSLLEADRDSKVTANLNVVSGQCVETSGR